MDTPTLDTPNNNRTEDERNTDAVKSLLGQAIPKDHDGMETALRAAEMRYISILSARVAAQAELQTMRLQYRHPKDKEYTDWDRKIMLDAHTSEAQAKYEQLAGIEKALEQRIAVIQALLIQ